MKASDLRKATSLIEALDLINSDIEVISNSKEPRLAVRIGSPQLKYRPSPGHYIEFLEARKSTIQAILNNMGIDAQE